MIDGERTLSKNKDVITIGDRRKRIEMKVERLCPTIFRDVKEILGAVCDPTRKMARCDLPRGRAHI